MIDAAVREQFDAQVLGRLRRLRRRLRLYLLLDGLAVLGPALLCAAAVTLLVDRTFKLDQGMRLGQLASLVGMLAVIGWRFILGPLTRPIGTLPLALLVERRWPDLRSRLISAVEFASEAAKERPRRSPALMDAVIQQARQSVSGLRIEDVLPSGRARRQAAITLGCVAVLVLSGVFAQTTMSIWLRRNVLLRNVEWPQRNRLVVEGLVNGRLIVPRGDDVRVVAAVEPGYEAPRQVFIEYRAAAGRSGRQQMPAFRSEPATSRPAGAAMPTDAETRFACTFEKLAETLECRIIGGDARTDWFTLETVDRPEIEQIALRITPPSYTRMEAHDLRSGQTVAQALAGSRVGLHVVTNRAIGDIHLVRRIAEHQEEVLPVSRENIRKFTAEDTPPASAVYWFRMTDVLGLSNISQRSRPVQVSIRLAADEPPAVKMWIKGAGELILNQAVLPIEIECMDTYGLSSASLVARPLGEKEPSAPTTQPVEGLDPGSRTFRRSLDWTPSSRGFQEGDRFSLHAESADFAPPEGSNIGRSQAIGFRLVSREELMAELNRREQEYRLDFERWVRRQEELYDDLLSLIGAAGQIPTEERSRQLQHLGRRQRDYVGRVGMVRAQFEQLLAELRVNRLSTATVEARLGAGVVDPLDALQREQMPAAADLIDRIPPALPADTVQNARQAQTKVLAAMKTILANMLKWEGYQEAITLLRDIENMQKQINQETEKRILDEVIGPATGGQR
ncbi:MAG TPA: hypothetical protein VLM89_16780 [Phycisphaerae bacterium]|nr:hypothetical protein [Phycisphaerae bacterium]